MKLNHLFAAVSLALASFSAAAVPVVSGIQINVSESSFLSAGWTEVSAASTNTFGNISAAVNGLAKTDRIAVGVRDNSTGLFLVIAETTLGSFQTHTMHNQTHDDNGVSWYHNAYSVGFTELGRQISQNAADTNLFNNMGLSWHAWSNGNFNASLVPTEFYPGWAANNGDIVSTWSDQFSRVFLTVGDDTGEVPEPASIALLAAGLLGMGVLRKKYK